MPKNEGGHNLQSGGFEKRQKDLFQEKKVKRKKGHDNHLKTMVEYSIYFGSDERYFRFKNKFFWLSVCLNLKK